MKKYILGLITALIVNISFGQQTEKLDYCNCIDKIDKITLDLNGKYERKCNGLLIEKGEFINGSKNGEWVTYSRKGKLIRRLNYNNGLLHGKVELFYINGKSKVTGLFEKGNKIGKWTYYTVKGKVLSEGSYEFNKPIGIWTINDKKGKKTVVQYDFNSKKYLINNPTPFHKDGGMIQNENTEEWYILKSPNKKYSSKPEPLGGYEFANYLFIELVEIPVNFWDTYVYNKYKVDIKISEEYGTTFKSQLFKSDLPEDNLEITFLTITNQTPKIKRVKHSDLVVKLLGFKINEAISMMQPWITETDISEVELYIHYVINENMYRK
ncbi:MAG: hypothetical protein GY756_15530 [bacterium]|nr:hypothetical protein [bacterium]